MRRIDFFDFFDVRKNDEKVDPTQMGFEQILFSEICFWEIFTMWNMSSFKLGFEKFVENKYWPSRFLPIFLCQKKVEKVGKRHIFFEQFLFSKIFFLEKYSPYEIWAPSNWVLKTFFKSEALLRDILSDTTERTVPCRRSESDQ